MYGSYPHICPLLGSWWWPCDLLSLTIRLAYMRKPPIIDEDRYRGEWVALNPKTYEVLGHSLSFKDARVAARRRGIDRPLMYGVPESDGYFVGGGLTLTS